MMKSSILWMVFLISMPSWAQQPPELKWRYVEELVFGFKKEAYTSDHILFYHVLLKRDEIENTSQNTSSSFTEYAKPLDIYKYWESRGEENYDVLLTKVAYVLDAPVQFFSKKRLADPNYISQTMPAAKIHKIDSTYHISVGFGAPQIDYALHFYQPEGFEGTYPKLNNYFEKYDGLDFIPELTVVQHNYKYGKIMFQRTNKMSVSISRYFQLNKEQTLVFNYTLNYIHNIPPAFLGGSDFLIDKIKQGIMALINQTQYVCRTTEFSE